MSKRKQSSIWRYMKSYLVHWLECWTSNRKVQGSNPDSYRKIHVQHWLLSESFIDVNLGKVPSWKNNSVRENNTNNYTF